jgi:hypothetical protein
MSSLDIARTAYVKVFQSHPLQRLKGKLPEKEILSRIGDALSHSQEWKDYQNAWIAENGVKPIFVYEEPISFKMQRKMKKKAPSATDHTYHRRGSTRIPLTEFEQQQERKL